MKQLASAATDAVLKIDELREEGADSPALNSVRSQMVFIRECADKGLNPKDQLDGREFSYGILSSRELASPAEISVKVAIDKVSYYLDRM